MAALATVADYVTRARAILNDAVPPYRYPDTDLIAALDLAITEAARIRPDMFVTELRTGALPSYLGEDRATDVAIDVRYRVPFLYYIVGHAQLRDDEGDQDQRAAAFMNTFTSKLLSTEA